jgi:FixJ family two-component response regulator
MPGLNSREILARLKGIRAGVPVILSSGFSETEVLRNFDREHIAGFLQKPYTAAQLREAVALAVEERV